MKSNVLRVNMLLHFSMQAKENNLLILFIFGDCKLAMIYDLLDVNKKIKHCEPYFFNYSIFN